MRNHLRLAFIGFGEVGRTFARGFAAAPDVALSAYDILFDRPGDGAGRAGTARELGVRVATSAADACRDADIVISAVTAASAGAVAAEAAEFLVPGQILFDINSAAPATKIEAARQVQVSGAAYVEGAVMAPVLAPGLQVPILAGGAQAAALSKTLNSRGMRIEPVATEIGRASAMKLCRSIVIKGLEAILSDCAAAAGHFGVSDSVFGSLRASYPSIDWAALAEAMGERVRTHGIRRAAEMREAGAMLADIGMDPCLSLAIADRHERIAADYAKKCMNSSE